MPDAAIALVAMPMPETTDRRRIAIVKLMRRG